MQDPIIQDDRVIFITAHNSLLTYTLPTSSATPILSGVLDSALRPLLWCAAFSKLSYGEMEDVLLAGGSMLGDILLWRPTSSSPVAPEPTKLLGHKVRLSLYQLTPYSPFFNRAASSTSLSLPLARSSRASATTAPSSSGTSRMDPAGRCGATKDESGA